MSQPTDYAINKIRSYVNAEISGGFANSTLYLVDRLNDLCYSGNPVAQSMVYTTFNAKDILNVLSASSVNNVLAIPATSTDILPLLNTIPHTETNIYWCNVWNNAYYGGGSITPSEYASLTGIINNKILDPSWNSGISWAQVELSRFSTQEDIDYSR